MIAPSSFHPKIDLLSDCAANNDIPQLFTILDNNREWTNENADIARSFIKQLHFGKNLDDQGVVKFTYYFFKNHPVIIQNPDIVLHFTKKLRFHYKRQHSKHIIFYLNLFVQCVHPLNPALPPITYKFNSTGNIIRQYYLQQETHGLLYLNNRNKTVAYLQNKEISSLIRLTHFVSTLHLSNLELNISINNEELFNPPATTKRFSQEALIELFATCTCDIFPFNSLNLKGNILTEPAMTALVSTINTKQSIRTLNLKHCGINIRTAQILAEGLRNNTSLTSLNLSNNPLEGGAVEVLLSSAAENNLEEINLCHIPISDRTVVAIQSFGTLMKKPKKILFSFENLTEQEYAFLTPAMTGWPYLFGKEQNKIHYIGDDRLSKNAAVFSFDTEGNPIFEPMTDRLIAIFNTARTKFTLNTIYRFDSRYHHVNENPAFTIDHNVPRENCYFLIDPNFIMVTGYYKQSNGPTDYFYTYLSLRFLKHTYQNHRISFITDDPSSTTIILEAYNLEGHTIPYATA